MSIRGSRQWLLWVVLSLSLAPGCQALYRYRPVGVEVRDAETHQPIPGAEVHINYPYLQRELAPWPAFGKTGNDGVVHLEAAPAGNIGVQVEAAANGYLAEAKSVSVESVQAIQPAGLFEAAEKRPSAITVEMYASPPPMVVLVLPNGYRGKVQVAIEARKDVACPLGQRTFRYEVPATGVVDATGPALLGRVFWPEINAEYADGTPLSVDATGDEIGFRWLGQEGHADLFLVGTKREAELQRRETAKENAVQTRSATEDSGGRRGRRKRGGDAGASTSGGSG